MKHINNNKRKSILLILLINLFFIYSCNKDGHECNSNIITKQTKNEPVEETNSFDVNTFIHYLNGTLSNLSSINNTNIKYSIFVENYQNNTLFHFTDSTHLNFWLIGKPFESQVHRRNFVLDSLSLTGNENDTNTQLQFESNIPNEYGNFEPLLFNNKRLAVGGATLWEHCDIVTRCGPTKGGNKTVAGWHRNLGWINNKSSQIDHYGVGWNSWCTDLNFKGSRSHWYFIANAKIYLIDMNIFNDNIESVY
jgi:hypothetical protein